MPLYAYTCQKCNAAFETLVTSSSPAECPECGSQELDRLPSHTLGEFNYKKIIRRSRAAAAKEGHFSNFSKSELKGKI